MGEGTRGQHTQLTPSPTQAAPGEGQLHQRLLFGARHGGCQERERAFVDACIFFTSASPPLRGGGPAQAPRDRQRTLVPPMDISLDTCAHPLGRAVLSMGSGVGGSEEGQDCSPGDAVPGQLSSTPACGQNRLEVVLGSELSLLSYCLVMTPDPPACGLFCLPKSPGTTLISLVLTKNLVGEKRHWIWSRKTGVQVLANTGCLSFSHSTNIHESSTVYWVLG